MSFFAKKNEKSDFTLWFFLGKGLLSRAKLGCFMTPLQTALRTPFSYVIEDEKSFQIKRLSLCQRIRHIRDASFYKGNVEAIARVGAETFKKMNRTSPRESQKEPLIRDARAFLKAVKGIKSDEVQKFKREFLAFTYAITSKAFDEKINPGFEEFAADGETRLELQMADFNHVLKEAPNGRISILCKEGKSSAIRPWILVKDIALKGLHKPSGGLAPRPSMPNLYNPPKIYGPRGLQPRQSLYDWTTLEPDHREENHSWGHRYTLSLCALSIEELRLTGEHCYWEIETPEGDRYCPGLYRSDNILRQGFAAKKGDIQNSDVSRRWPAKKGERHKITFEITKNDFLKIKKKVEGDHRNGVVFQVQGPNCTTYTLDLAKIAGIHIPIGGSFVSQFIPGKMYRTFQRIRPSLSPSLQTIHDRIVNAVHYPFAVLGNIGKAIFGGTQISPDFTSKERVKLKPKPLIESFGDLFDKSKDECVSPYMLAEFIKKLTAWRVAEGKKHGKDYSYCVPSQYCLSQYNAPQPV